MDESAPQPHQRRARYRGTHPRRFEERYKELRPEQYPQIHEHLRAQGRTPAGAHVPALLNEVMARLDPQPGEIVADCTVGYGGHAMEFLRRIGPSGLLVGADVDAAQLERARHRLEAERENVRLYRSNFAGIANPLRELGIEGYDVILADLGVSSMQLDDPSRGFSYKHDGPLDMRMDDRIPQTAADLLRTLSERDLADALRALADEPDAQSVARCIVQERERRPILRTLGLVEVICEAKGIARRARQRRAGGGALHPAALAFQALRMLVNDELGALKQLLRLAPHCLRPGGRIGIISFHSGEDRLVKLSFRDGVRAGAYAEAGDKPVRPSPEEIRSNPRSGSAKFRWARSACDEVRP
jgi:16S rRNA (cytosine1402-N4)-methyltransferase